MFTSNQPICSSSFNFSQTLTYSSVEKPQMFATTFLLKTSLSLGNSSEITLSTPGFCRPTEFIRPLVHSAILGVGLPNLGSKVVPLKEKEPRQLIS